MKKILTFLIVVFFGTGVFCQGLTVSENAYLTVKGGGIVQVKDGKLLVKATSSGMGSVLEDATSGNTISVSGSGAQTKVQTYIVADKYHYVSPPLTDATTNTFYQMWLKPFVESTNTWGDYMYEIVPMTVGKGYAAYSFSTGTPAPGTKSVDYVSTSTSALNNGTFSPAVSYSGTGKGNNLVGNPYPSAIDWNVNDGSGWTRTNIGNTIYIWNPVDMQYGTYTKGAGSGTHNVTNIILPGQGFFVKATNSDPVLSFNNNVRVHAGTGKTIFKNTNPYFKIRVEELSQGMSDEILVSFTPDGGTEFNDYDAIKWFSPVVEVPSLYTVKSGRNLAGNTYDVIDENLVIPMGFKKGAEGVSFRLFIDKPEDVSGIEQVYVKDKKTGTVSELVANEEYVFTSFDGDDPMRFEIMFKSSLGIEEPEKPAVQVWFADQQLWLRNPDENPVQGMFTIYNLTGQALLSSEFSMVSGASPFNVNVPFGAYIIEVISSDFRVTQKIIVN